MLATIKTLLLDNMAAKQQAIRDIDTYFEPTRLKVIETVEAIRDASIQYMCLSGSSNEGYHRLKSYEDGRQILSETVFEPHVSETMEVTANIGFNYGANAYNEKHNMIISCPSDCYVQFYDATTLLPMSRKAKRRIASSVVQMSYNSEIDTHIMGCAFGDIYAYNASKHELVKVLKHGDTFILAITFIDENTFAFSSSTSGMLFLGDLKTGKTVPYYSMSSDAWHLHHYKEQGFLLSGLANGKIIMYNTRKGSKYPIFDTFQAHTHGNLVTSITNIKVDGKEYVLTAGNDHTIKVYHSFKGKMRMLKSIDTEEDVSSILYLEEYKMIVATLHKNYVKFFKFPSGKIGTTLDLGLNQARNVFMMKDKNCIGVADLAKSVIKMVQLNSEKSEC